jgi:hypothetical protein
MACYLQRLIPVSQNIMDGGLVFNIYFGVNVIVMEVFTPKSRYTALATIKYQLIAAHDTRFDK